MRYFLDISYIGTAYAGWQIQQNALGIQQVLNEKLSVLLREKITCFASGRTDSGVHAIQQIVQFDTDLEIDAYSWLLKLNSILPNDVVANSIVKVKPDASARFDAISRTYHYKISQKRNPFLLERALFIYKELDLNKINEAANQLLLHTDFEAFSKVHTDVNHFHCTISEATLKPNDEILLFTIKANRFLRGMVRTIVGTLIDVGLNKINARDFENVILKKDRKLAGQSVSADGLYLFHVEYPESVYHI
ncbi:MAG: tRNA pseudouridine(38-40) synthase TruA [Opitutaceae bacterium]|nr:tRNA pseudouridine(38-40) synthase TruA [Cytophagales bacterium]